ncbi:MAG: hypothetical protein ACRDQW_01180 [Haloechinothrix sp.]
MNPEHADDPKSPLCPSAPPELAGAVIFGVVGGTATEPRVAHLVQPLPVTDEVLALAEPASPRQVFRAAAPCAMSACAHFAQNRCHLVTRVVAALPEAVDGLPVCRIRPDCRWWQQEGKAACLRCPLVVTDMVNPSELYRRVANPTRYDDGDVA